MLHKKGIALFIVLVMAATLFAACSKAPNNEEATKDPAAYADEFADLSASRKTEQIEGVETKTIFEAQNNILISVDYPSIPTKPAVSKQLENFANHIVDSFKAEVQTARKAENNENLVCELTMTYEPYLVGKDLLSIKFAYNEKAGAINRANTVESFVLDLSSDNRLQVFDLFDSSKEFLTTLSNAVRTKLQDHKVIQLKQDDALFEAGTSPKTQNFSNFIITPGQTINFFYNKNTIASKDADVIVAELPISELNDIINPAYLDLILGVVQEATPTADPAHAQNAVTPTQLTVLPAGPDDMTPGNLEGIDPLNDKVVALTFDDGPNTSSTTAILDALKANDAKATFFVVGNRVDQFKDLIKREYDEGHEIATHSFDHSSNNLKWTLDEINDQTGRTNDAIQAITGKRSIIDRPTGGSINEEIAKSIARPQILWSVDTKDWADRKKYSVEEKAELVFQEIMNNTKDGSIVLMHDLYDSTAQAAARAIPELKAQGYKFVTVTQLMQIAAARGQQVGYIFNAAPSAPGGSAAAASSAPAEQPAATEPPAQQEPAASATAAGAPPA